MTTPTDQTAAAAPTDTVQCFDCQKPIDAEAETTFANEAGDYAFCQECTQVRMDEARRQGAEALRMLARLTRVYHGKPATIQLSEFQAVVREVFSADPQQLELAADVLESDLVPDVSELAEA